MVLHICTCRFLTNKGIDYLREYLNLPSEIVPATLKKSNRPLERGPPMRGGDRGDRPPRREVRRRARQRRGGWWREAEAEGRTAGRQQRVDWTVADACGSSRRQRRRQRMHSWRRQQQHWRRQPQAEGRAFTLLQSSGAQLWVTAVGAC